MTFSVYAVEASSSTAPVAATTALGSESRQWLELETVPPARYPAKLHDEVVLECVAVGSPPPIIVWLKNGKPIESVPSFDSEELMNGLDARVVSYATGFSMAKLKSKLPIRCIRPEDEGEYSCVATQTEGYNGGHQIAASSLVVIEGKYVQRFFYKN